MRRHRALWARFIVNYARRATEPAAGGAQEVLPGLFVVTGSAVEVPGHGRQQVVGLHRGQVQERPAAA